MNFLNNFEHEQQDFDEKIIEKMKEGYKKEFSKLPTKEIEERIKSLNEENRFMKILMKKGDSWESIRSTIWLGGLSGGRQHTHHIREREAQKRALKEVLEERKS